MKHKAALILVLCLFLLSFSALAVQTSQYNGTYYPFDIGGLDNFSTNHLHLNGSTITATSKLGAGALEVGAGTMNATWGNITHNLSQIRTIEFWARTDVHNGDRMLLFLSDDDQTEYTRVWSDGSGQNEFFGTGGSGIDAGVWSTFSDGYTHFVYSFNETLAQVYVNDTIVVNQSTDNTVPLTAENFWIGFGNGVAFLDVKIDNLFLSYDKYGSQQVTESFNNGDGLEFEFNQEPGPEINVGFQSTMNETELSTSELLIDFYNITENTTAFLMYNNTQYNGTIDFTDEDDVMFDANFFAPLVETNGTTKTIQWNVTLDYVNGSQETIQVASDTQTIYHKYFPDNMQAPDGLEGDLITAQFNTSDGNVTPLNAFVEFDGINYSVEDGEPLVSANFFLPLLESENSTIYNVTYYLSFNYTPNNPFTRVATTNLTVFSWGLYACDATANTPALNFTLKDELNNTNINGSIGLNFEAYATNSSQLKNFTLNFTGSHNYPICMLPNFLNFTISGPVQYESPGYDSKLYTFQNALLTNVTQYIDLFLTNGTQQVKFKVVDTTDSAVQDVVIKVLSYDIGTGTSETTEIVQSNDEGEAWAQIVLNSQYYIFILEYQGEVKLQTAATIIDSTSKKFIINLLDDFYSDLNDGDGIAHSLTFDNDTTTFTYTFSDPSGLANFACLKVDRQTVTATTTLSYYCDVTTTGVIEYNITEPVGMNTYVAYATLNVSSTNTILKDVLTIEFDDLHETFGQSAIFMGFLLILTLALLGLAMGSPVVSGAMAMLGLFLTKILGIFSLGWPSLVGLFIIFGIFTWKMNR